MAIPASGNVEITFADLNSGSGAIIAKRGDQTWGENWLLHKSGMQNDLYLISASLSSLGGSIPHSGLLGLDADDHKLYLLVDGGRALGGNLNASGFFVSGVPTPVNPDHAVNKAYADSLVVTGINDWQNSVLDKDLSTPPGGPSIGDRYIVATGGTGAWTGADDYIAQWNGASWDLTVPNEGFACTVEDENAIYYYTGSAWVRFGTVLDHGNLNGLGDNDHPQYLLRDGTNAMTAILNVGGNIISGVAAGTFDNHAVNLLQMNNSIALLSGTLISDMDTKVADVSGTLSAEIDADVAALSGTMDSKFHERRDIDLLRSTSVISGGLLSVNADPTKIDISAGSGIVVDSYTDPAAPVVTEVTWPAFTAIDPTGIFTGTSLTTFAINSAGAIVQVDAFDFTRKQYRDLIVLGTATHPVSSGQVLDTVERAHVGFDAINDVRDFIDTFGSFNVDGNIYSGLAGTLNIGKSSGQTFFTGINYDDSPSGNKRPSIKDDSALGTTTFRYLHRDGAGGFIEPTTPVSVSGFISDVEPDLYDNNTGSLVAVPVGEYTIQPLLYITGVERTFVQFGQETFSTIEAAREAAHANSAVIDSTLKAATLRGWMVLPSGATDLTDPSVEFIPASRFGLIESVGGAAPGVTDHSDLTGLASDDHTQYLLVNGTRAMTGQLNMGSNIISGVSNGTFDNHAINRSQLIDVSGHLQSQIGGGADVELIFDFKNSTNTYGDYPVWNVASNGTGRGLFVVPANFSSLTSLELLCIVQAGGAAATGRDIDFFTEYGAIGEDYQTHVESDTTTTYDLSAAADEHYSFNISGVFSSLAAGDSCAIEVDHNGVGGTISYYAIRMVYTPT